MTKEQTEWLQVVIDRDDKIALKHLATDRRTTVSAIVRDWVRDGLAARQRPTVLYRPDHANGDYVEVWWTPVLDHFKVVREEWVRADRPGGVDVRHILEAEPVDPPEPDGNGF